PSVARLPPLSSLFPYTTLFRSLLLPGPCPRAAARAGPGGTPQRRPGGGLGGPVGPGPVLHHHLRDRRPGLRARRALPSGDDVHLADELRRLRAGPAAVRDLGGHD